MTEIVERIYTVGRHKLCVLEAGPEDGQSILLIHGIPARARLWEDVMPVLVSGGYRVFAPDLPGYGGTEIDPSELYKAKEEQAYSLKGAADLLAEWWIEQGFKPAVLIGHDIGGGVAQIYACDHQSLINRFIISNSIVEDLWPVFAIGLIKAIAGLGLYPINAILGGFKNPYTWNIMKKSVADKSKMTKEIAEHVFWSDKLRTKQGRIAFGHHLKALSPKQLKTYGDRLSSVTVPSLLLWAMSDPNQPWDPIGRRFEELMPEAKVEHFENAGHFFQFEKAENYAVRVMAWIEGR